MTPQIPSDEQLVSFCRDKHGALLRVARYSDTVIVKCGMDITPAEAATQLYAWKHADPRVIYIPEPYRFFQHTSRVPGVTIGYLVMEYVSGTDLSSYLKSASSLEEAVVVNSIVNMLDHLSAMPLPAGQGPGPVGGGPPKGYLWSDRGLACSFASVSELEHWLNRTLSEWTPDLHGEKLSFGEKDLVMCHTDLAPRNILRLRDGRLALLDWGSAGFYPKIFETYTFRTRVNREPIFEKILPRLANDETKIQLLARIEQIMIRSGDTARTINFKSQPASRDIDVGFQGSAPPPPPPSLFNFPSS